MLLNLLKIGTNVCIVEYLHSFAGTRHTGQVTDVAWKNRATIYQCGFSTIPGPDQWFGETRTIGMAQRYRVGKKIFFIMIALSMTTSVL
jgi:hypothetical protein